MKTPDEILLTALRSFNEPENFKFGRRYLLLINNFALEQVILLYVSVIITVRFVDDVAIIAKPYEEAQDVVNRLGDTERMYGMEINIENSQVIRVSRSNK